MTSIEPLELDDIEIQKATPKHTSSTKSCCNLTCCGICCFTFWIFIAILFGILCAIAQPAKEYSILKKINSSSIIGHRGSIRLFPESTLFTFKNAISMGMDVIECDLRQTKDGHIVLLHDESTARTTQRASSVQELTLSQVKELDAGYWWSTGARYARGGSDIVEWTTYPYRSLGIKIPTLIELFEHFPTTPKIIELKTESNVGVPPYVITETCALIKKYKQTTHVVVASFSEAALVIFRKECPDVATGTGVNGVISMFVASMFGSTAAFSPASPSIHAPQFFNLPVVGTVEVLTKSFIAGALSRNVHVGAYDVDDANIYLEMIDRGLNGGVITDRIDVLLAASGRLLMSEVSQLKDIKTVGSSCACRDMHLLHTATGCDMLHLNASITTWQQNLTEYKVTCPTQEEVMSVSKEKRWEMYDDSKCKDGCRAASYCEKDEDGDGKGDAPCCIKKKVDVPVVENRTVAWISCMNDTKPNSSDPPDHIEDEKSLL